MTIDEMRKAVKDAYQWKLWREKVDRMSDKQVVAVYNRLKAQNKV